MSIRDDMITYGITAEAAVERLAELGDLDRKARKENHNAASPDHMHDWELGGDGLICWCGVTKGPANALPSAESFVARRLGRDARQVGKVLVEPAGVALTREEEESALRDAGLLPQIPSFTVYIDCVGKHPTPGDVAEVLLRHFEDAVHIEVIPR